MVNLSGVMPIQLVKPGRWKRCYRNLTDKMKKDEVTIFIYLKDYNSIT